MISSSRGVIQKPLLSFCALETCVRAPRSNAPNTRAGVADAAP